MMEIFPPKVMGESVTCNNLVDRLDEGIDRCEEESHNECMHVITSTTQPRTCSISHQQMERDLYRRRQFASVRRTSQAIG